jgi:hypothetical protein
VSRLAYCVSFRLSVRARPDSESWVRTRIRKDISTKYVVPYSSLYNRSEFGGCRALTYTLHYPFRDSMVRHVLRSIASSAP